MGCICSKPGENSNVNLDPLKVTHIKLNKLDLANQNENTTNNATTEDLINASLGKNLNINNVDNIISKQEDFKPQLANNLNESQNNLVNENNTSKIKKEKGINKDDLNEEFVRLLNEFRANPSKLADMLVSEIKNISVNVVSGKEVNLYKGLYCINGKEELFLKVSDQLRALPSMGGLEYRKTLEIEIDPKVPPKGATNEEKKRIQKENEDDIKAKYKKLKELNGSIYKKYEILSHTMNENIIDSIIMQIVSNFGDNTNPKIKRPFDIIFNRDLQYIGISLVGKKKFSGNIIFAA